MTLPWYTLVSAIIIVVSIPCIDASVLPGGRKVVLMSMDGFRHDYLTKFDVNMTHFEALLASGVKVPYVNNTFVTLTFPCHYTIVTGLYEESHGIVDNSMYDPEFDSFFNMGNVETRWWNGGVPIWTTAVKAGLKVGTFFWPGSEVEFNGTRPTEWKRYNGSVGYEDRVDTVVTEWLSKADFDFGVIYFDEPDHSGHMYGPDGPEMAPVLKRMDDLLGYFMKKLEDENLKDKVDFIVTSDHGMTEISRTKRQIVITEVIDSYLISYVVGGGAVAQIIPRPGKSRELLDALSKIDHLTAYSKKDVPEHYHFRRNRRVMPVVVVADEGWEVRRKRVTYPGKGNHGYDNAYMSMKPIFIATGPSFKKGEEVAPIKSVDIYPLLCHLLNIEPAPNNGSFDRVAPLLRHPGAPSTTPPTTTSMKWTPTSTVRKTSLETTTTAIRTTTSGTKISASGSIFTMTALILFINRFAL